MTFKMKFGIIEVTCALNRTSNTVFFGTRSIFHHACKKLQKTIIVVNIENGYIAHMLKRNVSKTHRYSDD